MKTTVIYHSADYDGIFCREIARKFIGDAKLIGWNFGDNPISIPRNGNWVILDLPIDKPFGISFKNGYVEWPDGKGQPFDRVDWEKFVWIDHHKSAIESHPKDIPGYRIDGVAACRLAWQWFREIQAANRTGEAPRLPEKRQFVERIVSEPLAVRLAGEYDIWDKRDPDAELFQHGLRSKDLENDWDTLLSDFGDPVVGELLERGEAIQYSKTKENEDIITHYGFTLKWEGLTFLACNHARYNSHLFTAGLKPEHDACLGFKWNGKGKWEVSLYHATGKEHHDLSQIAVKYGGGGHRGACGFVAERLEFIK